MTKTPGVATLHPGLNSLHASGVPFAPRVRKASKEAVMLQQQGFDASKPAVGLFL